MRIGAAVGIVVLLATVVSTVANASKEIYLNGGVAISNLRDDAELFGQAFAVELENEIPGTTWNSDMKSRTGFDGGIGFRFSKDGTIGGAIELRYANRGAHYKLTETNGSGFGATAKWKLSN